MRNLPTNALYTRVREGEARRAELLRSWRAKETRSTIEEHFINDQDVVILDEEEGAID